MHDLRHPHAPAGNDNIPAPGIMPDSDGMLGYYAHRIRDAVARMIVNTLYTLSSYLTAVATG